MTEPENLPPMNIILQTAEDTIADAGMNYFISLYGFSPAYIGNQIPIHKVIPETPVITNEYMHGWITWNDAKIPVFQKPSDLSTRGEELLVFSDGTVSYPCAVVHGNEIIISIDIFSHLGLFASGYLERVWNNLKDGKKEFITFPFADYFCDFLLSCILLAQKNNNAPLVHKSFWPGGKCCAVCLTHDVDEVRKTYQWVTRPLRLIMRGRLGNIKLQFRSFIQKIKGNEPYWTFDEILRIERSRGVKSSLYFLKETGKVRMSDRSTWRHFGRRYNFNDVHLRKLFQTLNSGGWEVGLHGSFYSYLDREKLRSEKEALEHSVGTLVTGGRQHNLNLKIPETWLIQESAGLLYDSTLGFNDSLGFRWGISFPFRPFFPKENRSLGVVQIPLAVEDLPYFRSSRSFNHFKQIFKNVGHVHGVLTLLWHHSVFNENEFPGGASQYIKILDYCKEHNAWIGSSREIHEWWTHREKTTINGEYDGTHLKITASPGGMQHFIKIYLPDSLKIKEINNASVIIRDRNSCEIKTEVTQDGEYIGITFSEI